jgi:hypothetical protein
MHSASLENLRYPLRNSLGVIQILRTAYFGHDLQLLAPSTCLCACYIISPIHTMAHLCPPGGRIPLPQLPPLPFESLTENECDAQCQSPSSVERLLSISSKAWASAEYNKLQSAEGRLESSDENTGVSFIGYGDACDPSIATISSAQSKGVPDLAQDWLTRWFLEWWMMEILSWLFGLACMVVITVILWEYDGKPNPEWKIGISIASLISILSGFTKSALLLPTAEGEHSPSRTSVLSLY